ncbi:MAG: hypothetical protein JNK82_17420 [Myxococcaceae bacterium]|nr:hypothetical protein [Myxococcaceae bacterium]
MALKNVMVAAVLAMSIPAFASSRVEEALSLNSTPAKKAEKAKAPKAKVFDSLNTSETHKTELPKNARHDATAGVFI